MSGIFATLLTILSIFLILLILVQRGRGGGLTGALGGMGGSSAFGAKAGDIFTRITIVTATIWIGVCVAAAFWSNPAHHGDRLGGIGTTPASSSTPDDKKAADTSSPTSGPATGATTTEPASSSPAGSTSTPPSETATPPATAPPAETPSTEGEVVDRARSPRSLRSLVHRQLSFQEYAAVLASMTGFGEARRQIAGLNVLVEVRTINNRHFKLSFRASEGYSGLEPDVEAVVRDIVRRGTVQVNLRIDRQASPDDFRVNTSVLESYRKQLEAFLQQHGSKSSVGLETLVQLPGVIDPASRANLDPRDDWPLIEDVLREALAAVVKMRADEGAALLADLASNGRIVEQFLDKVAERAPQVSDSYRERLAQRVNKALAELNVTLQPADLIREVSLFVDRSDVSEEIVRLRSHLQQFVEALNLPESSGRKLEFIVQEMGREVNTIGSKGNDAEISRHVIEMKSALERIREQIQNVE